MKTKHKSQVKLLAAMLSVLLIFPSVMCGCVDHSQKHPAGQITDESTAPAVTTARPDGLVKEYCTASLDNWFLDNEVIVEVFPEYASREYTLEDFPEIDGISIYARPVKYQGGDKPHIYYIEGKTRSYTITLETKSKQHVLDCIKLLEKREDMYNVRPAYFDIPCAVPDDE